MINNKLLQNWQNAIAALPYRQPLAVLLRHAERQAILPGTVGNDVNLTPQGVDDCQLIAELYKDRNSQFFSSPVRRCIQTAEHLQYNPNKDNIKTTPLLGGPGVFIQCSEKAQHYILENSAITVVDMLLSSEQNLPGFCDDTRDAINRLLAFIMTKSYSKELSFFITHDIILAVLLGYLFPKINLDVLWPNYLDCLFIWKMGDSLMANYRNDCKLIAWPMPC